MHPLEEYALEKEQKNERFESAVVELFVMGNLTESQLRTALNKAYKNGHYAGHCRGELFVKQVYGMINEEEIS